MENINGKYVIIGGSYLENFHKNENKSTEFGKKIDNANGAWGSGKELAGEDLVDKCKICQNVSTKQLSDSAQIMTQYWRR